MEGERFLEENGDASRARRAAAAASAAKDAMADPEEDDISPLQELVLWKRPMLSVLILACGSLLYHHCTYRNCSLVSLACDVLIVLVASLGILGLLFRNFNISVPVDPLEWQVSQESATSIAAFIANTIGATESVLRVAASGSDYKLFLKVVTFLYLTAAVGRAASGATIAFVAFLATFIVPFLIAKLKPSVFFQHKE